MKPTKKQLSFISEICDVLEIDNPNCKTIEEASDWIGEHLSLYNLKTECRWMEFWEAEDYEAAGMQVYDEYDG